MAIQSETELAMTMLGIVGDTPPDPLQSPLVNAIHLRWAFGGARSFPWYGYFLFRRPVRKHKSDCVSRYLRMLGDQLNIIVNAGPQSLNSNSFNTSLGVFTSDRILVLTDDFIQSGLGELDLRNRKFLRFTCAQPAFSILYKVGVRREKEKGHTQLTCIRFSREDANLITNPRVKNDVSFLTYDHLGRIAAASDVKQTAVEGAALNMGFKTHIKLPCPADYVEMLFINIASPGKVVGLDSSEKPVVSALLDRTENRPGSVTLKGHGIAGIDVIAPQNETLLLSLCYHCQGDEKSNENEKLLVRFFAGTTLLHEELVTGNPGDIVEGKYSANNLTAIEFTGGNAALVDICVADVRAAFRGGWKPLERCTQPINLPIRHPNYPASGSQPTNLAVSEAHALGRIRYGNSSDWSGPRFQAMHDAMHDIVAGGPAGPAMKDVGSNNVPGVSGNPAEQNSPNLAKFRPMNYLVMGSLYAPIAQMLGLYWADETAVPGERYDYLIVADMNNVGHHNAAIMLAWLNSPALNFDDIDAWICFNSGFDNPPPLAKPTGLKSYALPGATSEKPDGTVRDMTCNTGLTWDILMSSGKLNADAAIMYMVRRASLGNHEPAAPVPTTQHHAITQTPHLVIPPIVPSGTLPAPPANWPDKSFCYIDAGLTEGWYSYCINGVDIFGRYSGASGNAAWYQWTPKPDPAPWYYIDAVGDGIVEPHAISLLDKTPPPTPTAVEAFALDPNDPNLIRDAAYNNWFATLSAAEKQAAIGLRVRWLWAFNHMRQALDTKEFRIYYHNGQPNSFKGRVTAVNPAVANHSTVNTTIAHAQTAGAFVNCYIRTGGRSFRITGSSAASPLVLTVLNVAPDFSIPPEDGGVCSVNVPPGHPVYYDLSKPTKWNERRWVVDYNNFTMEGVAAAPEPEADAQLAGEGATVAGTVVTLPAGRNISAIRPFYFHLFLAEDAARPSRIYKVIAVNATGHQVTVDGNPILPPGISGWELGVLVRRYELFLPAPGDADRGGLNLNPARQQPIVHAQLGVTAVDDKNHTADDPARAGQRWADRTGNESNVGGPATVFCIYRVPPPPVVMPPDSDDVFASKADYNGKSYYTFRWVRLADVDTHIFRAMDQAVYQRDWLIRQTRTALSGTTHERFFPEGWNAGRRNAAAAELNVIGSSGDYAGLSADAQEVLGRLPGNDGHKSKGTLYTHDWLVRRTRSNLSTGDLEFFPPEWGAVLKRQSAANLLNAISEFSDYGNLTNDANRVLAGLPGNEGAFQQITDRPLPNTGTKTANRLGPDNPATFVIDPNLRAYIDAIDGRSTNKYFYRAAFVDAAQNVGSMSPSSPPVHMPDVLPPRMPVFTRVLAGDPDPMQQGDRKITLRWASNREPDLASYRVYRTDKEENARDIRLMALVQTVVVLPGDPTFRLSEVVWLDDTVLGLITYYYRLVAVDNAGNQSAASPAIAARAFDTALPEVPALTLQWVEQAGIFRAEISWSSFHQVMIQRQEGSGNWIDLAQWRAPGAITIRDPFSDSTHTYRYRVLVRKYTGALKRGEPAVLHALP